MTKKSNLNSNNDRTKNAESIQVRREQMLVELQASMRAHHNRMRTIKRTLIGIVGIALVSVLLWTLTTPIDPGSIATPESGNQSEHASRSVDSKPQSGNGLNVIVPAPDGQRFERIGNEEMLELMAACGLPAILGEVDGEPRVIVIKNFALQ
ncbi:MAG: hypothetical protein AB8B55_01295 [Mariniblastus sp.]